MKKVGTIAIYSIENLCLIQILYFVNTDDIVPSFEEASNLSKKSRRACIYSSYLRI